MKPSILLAMTLATTAPLSALAETFNGYAYDLKTGKPLYTEVHDLNGNTGTVNYYALDGSLLGKKTLSFASDPFIPVFRMDMSKSGYAEGISAVGGSLEMYKIKAAGQKEERSSVKKGSSMAADAGFHRFIQSRFADLLAGKTVAFQFAVPGQLDTYKFKAKKTGDTSFEGKPAVQFLVEPDSLLRVLADPLQLTYDPSNKKLLEYRGVSNVHNPANGKAYNVRISYFGQKPKDAGKTP
jgi:uncharacterized protein (DUF2147 family)